MAAVLPFLVLVFVLAAVLGGLALLARAIRRSGRAGEGARAAMAAWEEAYKTTSYRSYQEARAQAGRKGPLESPGDR